MASELRVPRLLRVREVAELTGLDRWRLYDLIRRGEGPPVMRIGKTFRVAEDALIRWIHERSEGRNR